MEMQGACRRVTSFSHVMEVNSNVGLYTAHATFGQGFAQGSDRVYLGPSSGLHRACIGYIVIGFKLVV